MPVTYATADNQSTLGQIRILRPQGTRRLSCRGAFDMPWNKSFRPVMKGSQTTGENSASATTRAGAILLAMIVIWSPSIAKSESSTPAPAVHGDTPSVPSPAQSDPFDAREKALESVQRGMQLGVAGIPGTQIPPALTPSIKSGATRYEGPKQIPVVRAVSVWEQLAGYRLVSMFVFAAFTTTWLLYRLRHRTSEIFRAGSRWFDAKALGVHQIVNVDDLDYITVLTPAALRQRGWSVDLMVDLLGPPDFAVVDPTGRNPPLILVAMERVEAMETSGKVGAYREGLNRRMQEDRLQLTKWKALHGELHPSPLTRAETVW